MNRIARDTVLATIAVFMFSASALADMAHRVKDIYPGPTSSDTFVSQLIKYGDAYYFDADDGVHGAELWKTDGTAAGTQLAVDLSPGALPSNPMLEAGNSTGVFFTATVPGFGTELWRSQGSPASTNLAYDSGAGDIVSLVLDEAAATNSLFFFRGHQTNEITGLPRLWVTDGTLASTKSLFQVSAGGSFPADGQPLNGLAATNDALYLRFSRLYGGNPTGIELGRSDGTAAGTVVAADILPGSLSSNPAEITPFGSNVVFTATAPSGARTLWQYNSGPTATNLFANLGAAADSLNPSGLFASGPYGYFSADDSSQNTRLWRTDGTTTGTIPISQPGGAVDFINPADFSGTGGNLYFAATRAGDGNHRTIWKSDGTTAGTRLFADLDPRDVFILDVTAAGSRAFVAGFISNADGTFDTMIWLTDGTPLGTSVVYQLVGASDIAQFHDFTWTGSQLLFYAPSSLDATGRPIDEELWTASVPEPRSFSLALGLILTATCWRRRCSTKPYSE